MSPIKIIATGTGQFVIRDGPQEVAEYPNVPSAKAFRDAYEEARRRGQSSEYAFRHAQESAASPDVLTRYSDVPDENFTVPGADPAICGKCFGQLDSGSGACPRCEPGKFRPCGLCGSPVWRCCC
jgi:hypothetical protein